MALPDTRISLLQRLHDGHDTAAWTEFCAIYERAIFRIALKYGLQDADAREVSQEVLLTVSRRIRHFDLEAQGRFRSWLLSIAYREFLMSRRRAKSWNRVLGLMGAGREESEQTELLSAQPSHAGAVDAALDVERHLALLKGPEKEVILLCDAYGFSHSEVAKLMGTPLGTVKSHALRGRKRLQAALDGDADE